MTIQTAVAAQTEKMMVPKKKPDLTNYDSDIIAKMITTEAGIYHSWFQDFYVIIGNEKDKMWSVKIYQNPLVSLIWIGVIIMVLSGFLGIRRT